MCVDVDGYKIVNVYKPPPTQLRSLDLSVFLHSCLYDVNFNCRHVNCGYDDKSPEGGCFAGWVSINSFAFLDRAKNAAGFYSGRSNTSINPDLTFACVSPDSRLPNRCVCKKFSWSPHIPSLITPAKFPLSPTSMLVKQWKFRITKWRHYVALTNKFAKILLPPDPYFYNFVTLSKKQPKRLSLTVIETITFRLGIRSVNSFKKFSEVSSGRRFEFVCYSFTFQT